MTLARRHYQRVTASRAAASAAPDEPIDASAYELQLLQLAEHKRRLREVQSIERRIEMKRQLLPLYEPWVEGVLEGGRGGQDAVLMTVMLWRIDVGDFAGALPIARYALAHGMAMPDEYERSAPAVLAEETADRALAAFGTGGGFELAVLVEVAELTDGHDMHDQVRAKLLKALGLAQLAAAGEAPFVGDGRSLAESAQATLRRALQLNDRVGVKKELERLERALRHSPPADAGDASGQGSDDQASSSREESTTTASVAGSDADGATESSAAAS